MYFFISLFAFLICSLHLAKYKRAVKHELLLRFVYVDIAMSMSGQAMLITKQESTAQKKKPLLCKNQNTKKKRKKEKVYRVKIYLE